MIIFNSQKPNFLNVILDQVVHFPISHKTKLLTVHFLLRFFLCLMLFVDIEIERMKQSVKHNTAITTNPYLVFVF